MASGDLVRAGVDGAVAGILLNQPDTGNAWSAELAWAYHDALEDAAADPDVRVIVVSGAGEAFCTTAAGPDPVPATDHGPLHALAVPKPVIAAINGACSGEGLVEALLCDIRFTSTKGTFSAPWVRLGRPAPEATAWLVPRLIGTGAALDLLLSGRELDATDAAGAGLVQDVFVHDELMPGALAYARALAESCDPAAVATVKAQVYRALELGLAEAIDEARAIGARFPSPTDG